MPFVLFSSLLLAFGSTVLAQTTPADSAAPAQVSAASTSADEDFLKLKGTFDRLHRAINRQGGMTDRDRSTIETMYEQTKAFNQAHPDYGPGIAQEIQLALWLNDTTQANVLMEKLWRANQDNRQLSDFWLRFSKQNGTADDQFHTYRSLVEAYPDDRDLRQEWLETFTQRGDAKHVTEGLDFLMGTNASEEDDFLQMRLHTLNSIHRYLQVIEWVDAYEARTGKEPTADMLLAKIDALYAIDRFNEATTVIDQAIELSRETDDEANLKKFESLSKRMASAVTLWDEELAIRSAEAAADNNPRVLLITNKGQIVLELFEDSAPNTTANFLELVEDGFYNQNRFNRLNPAGQIFAGAPNPESETWQPGEDRWGVGYRIPDELGRRMFSGSLGMYKRGVPTREKADSGSSQFFLSFKRLPGRDDYHPIFGRVVDGLDVARSLQRNDTIESAMVVRKRDHDYEVTKIYTDMDTTPDGPIKRLYPTDSSSEPINITPTTLTPPPPSKP